MYIYVYVYIYLSIYTYIHNNVYTGVPRATEVDTMRLLLLQVS